MSALVSAYPAALAALIAGGPFAELRARLHAIIGGAANEDLGLSSYFDRWTAPLCIKELDEIEEALARPDRTPLPEPRTATGRLFVRPDLDVDDVAAGMPGYLVSMHEALVLERLSKGEWSRNDAADIRRRPVEVTDVVRLGGRGFITAVEVRDEVSGEPLRIRRTKSWPGVFTTPKMAIVGGKLVKMRKAYRPYPRGFFHLRLGSRT